MGVVVTKNVITMLDKMNDHDLEIVCITFSQVSLLDIILGDIHR